VGDGEPGERVGSSVPGAGPIGCAPLSAHAAASVASTAIIAMKRFMGCLLLSGTRPMFCVDGNTGTPRVSRFGNRIFGEA
jgi:hypothetical protein